MARYIDADKLLESVTREDWNDWTDHELFRYYVEEAPPADVVPKSEVDRLQHILDSYALQYGTVMDKHIVIEKAREEVAREIIADMRELIKGYENIDIYLDRIEKKYTESES